MVSSPHRPNCVTMNVSRIFVPLLLITGMTAQNVPAAGPAAAEMPLHAGRLLQLPVRPYSRSGINTGIFRRHALLTLDSQQLITYFTRQGTVIVIRRSLADDQMVPIYETDRMPESLLGDGHQGISMGRSADGRVHLLWGCHDTASPQYRCLAFPDVRPEVAAVPPWAGFSPSLSYPQFYGPPDRLILSFRRDGTNSAENRYDHCLVRYEAASKTWIPLQVPLIRFPPDPLLAYLNSIGERSGTLVTAFTIRRYDLMDTSDPQMRVMNESFRIVLSRDGGTTWSNMHGETLPSPIPAFMVPPDVHIDPDQNLINQGGGWLGKEAYHFAYFRNDEDGVPQIHLTTVELLSGTITTELLSRRERRFDLLGRGTQSWPISRPAIVELGSTLIVVYRDENRLRGVFRSSHHKPWKVVNLYEGILGNYEPIIDYTSSSRGRLAIYIQPSWQGSDDQPHADAPDAKAWLLELTESDLYGLPLAPDA